MIAPYIAIGITGALATYRTAGAIRLWIAYETGMTLALKLCWALFHVYDPLWRGAEPLGVVLAALVVRERAERRYAATCAISALVVHVWAACRPERWPGSWLEAEIHLMAFCWLVLGLMMLWTRGAACHGCVAESRAPTAPRVQNFVLAALFLATAAAYYPTPWAPAVRGWLMWFEAVAFLALALPISTSLAVGECQHGA